MSDVAKAAGMSKKTVYQLIESKAELFTVLLAHHQARLKFPVSLEGLSMKETLVQNLLCLARFLLSPEQIALIRLIMAEYTHSPDLGRLFLRQRMLKAKTQIESCLVKAAARDGMRLADVREMSALLFGMALGEFHLATLIGFRSAPGKAVLERRIRRAVDLFVAGHGTINHP
jgi:AcrR family transcriptional regulator